MSVRAAVRAKVSLSMAAVQTEPSATATCRTEAKDYLQRAIDFLAPVTPRIVAIGGLSGSGKSTVARALAPFLTPAPGAVVLRSDVIRKTLLGIGDLAPLGPDGYAPAVSQQVYDILIARSRSIAANGLSVIADATFTKPKGRAALADAAAAAGVTLAGFWLEADAATLVARVAARRNDPSDADAEVVRRQLAEDLGTIAWTHVDATQPAAKIAEDIVARIGKMP